MKIQKSEPVKTVLTITVGFIVIYLTTRAIWALYVSLIVGLIGMFSTYLAEKIDLLWMKLTKLLSYIVPNILLSIIFYIFLFPISVLSRLFGNKDPLKLKDPGATVFTDHKKGFDKSSFEKAW